MNRPIPTALIIIAAYCLTSCSSNTAPAQTPPSPMPTAAPSRASMGEEYINEPETNRSEEEIEMHAAPDPNQQRQVVLTAEQFVEAWLEADPAQRANGLEGITSRALLEGFTDPRFRPIHAKPTGPTHLSEFGVFQASTVHRLDGGRVVELTLVLEPDANHGWQVITIQER